MNRLGHGSDKWKEENPLVTIGYSKSEGKVGGLKLQRVQW